MIMEFALSSTTVTKFTERTGLPAFLMNFVKDVAICCNPTYAN